MKKLLVMLLVVVLAFGLVACGEKEAENEATYTLKVSLMDGSVSAMPVWVGLEEGIFEKYGIELELSTFTNGMVQIEAIDTYDVGITGIGGILAGTLRYGGTVIDLTCSDDGTQYIYGRPDSNVVASGKGHNTLNPEIYGSAEGWKGAEVLSVKGNVMEYMMLKVLSGVGLTLDDVNPTWVDQPTCNTSLIAGQGDVATINGPSSYTPDKE
ncbi:MAG: ABC transporter substrate-binding protein, partial [Firmicutes bacterium]|nr:ABC transporter substrate-binding protein [Bacillota bacterium]